MTTLVTVLATLLTFAVLFVIFGVLGSGERVRPCAGRGAGEVRCRGCPAAQGGLPAEEGCPGTKTVKAARRR